MNHDQSAVQYGEAASLCRVSVADSRTARQISVQLYASPSMRKTILLDDRKISRFSELMGCLQCVIFSPEDLGLIREGPSVRRRFLDMMISQVNRKYFIALQQYRVGLDQRNALLKTLKSNRSQSADWLSDFDRALAGPAEMIVRERKTVCERLNQLAMESYRRITGLDQEEFALSYHSSLKDEEKIGEALISQLTRSREEDIRLGLTSAGPHRDDLLFSLNRRNMRMFASQGQTRTAALSIKIAEMNMLMELSGEKPILLLDDVMSELDQYRRDGLLREIASFQTFITCTDRIDLMKEHQRFFSVSSHEGKGEVKKIHSESDPDESSVSHETLKEDPLFV